MAWVKTEQPFTTFDSYRVYLKSAFKSNSSIARAHPLNLRVSRSHVSSYLDARKGESHQPTAQENAAFDLKDLKWTVRLTVNTEVRQWQSVNT